MQAICDSFFSLAPILACPGFSWLPFWHVQGSPGYHSGMSRVLLVTIWACSGFSWLLFGHVQGSTSTGGSEGRCLTLTHFSLDFLFHRSLFVANSRILIALI